MIVRCDIKSRGRDVFDMVVAHANLVEHFYFGLAFIDGNFLFPLMADFFKVWCWCSHLLLCVFAFGLSLTALYGFSSLR